MAATLAHDAQDPSSSSPHAPQAVAPTTQLQHNAAVTIEEYMYWAAISRHEESKLPKIKGPLSNLLSFGKNKSEAVLTQSFEATSDAPMREMQPGKPPSTTVSDAEWQQAQRAGRTAGWAAIFYLISTDVLGPYSVPWAMAQMGYGPGISLYAVFGALAGYTGWQVWHACSPLVTQPTDNEPTVAMENVLTARLDAPPRDELQRHRVPHIRSSRTPRRQRSAVCTIVLPLGRRHHRQRPGPVSNQREHLLRCVLHDMGCPGHGAWSDQDSAEVRLDR
jgi:hypothetical protein